MADTKKEALHPQPHEAEPWLHVALFEDFVPPSSDSSNITPQGLQSVLSVIYRSTASVKKTPGIIENNKEFANQILSEQNKNSVFKHLIKTFVEWSLNDLARKINKYDNTSRVLELVVPIDPNTLAAQINGQRSSKLAVTTPELVASELDGMLPEIQKALNADTSLTGKRPYHCKVQLINTAKTPTDCYSSESSGTSESIESTSSSSSSSSDSMSASYADDFAGIGGENSMAHRIASALNLAPRVSATTAFLESYSPLNQSSAIIHYYGLFPLATRVKIITGLRVFKLALAEALKTSSTFYTSGAAALEGIVNTKAATYPDLLPLLEILKDFSSNSHLSTEKALHESLRSLLNLANHVHGKTLSVETFPFPSSLAKFDRFTREILAPFCPEHSILHAITNEVIEAPAIREKTAGEDELEQIRVELSEQVNPFAPASWVDPSEERPFYTCHALALPNNAHLTENFSERLEQDGVVACLVHLPHAIFTIVQIAIFTKMSGELTGLGTHYVSTVITDPLTGELLVYPTIDPLMSTLEPCAPPEICSTLDGVYKVVSNNWQELNAYRETKPQLPAAPKEHSLFYSDTTSPFRKVVQISANANNRDAAQSSAFSSPTRC